MGTAKGAMTRTPGAVATETEPAFERGRHLAFAIIALAHAPLVGATAPVVLRITSSQAWSAELATLNVALQLCFVAFVAWLAFAVFDTRAGVTVWPKRWRDIGWPLAAWCVAQEVFVAASVWRWPAEHVRAYDRWLATFTELGELHYGWLAASMLAAAAAEEIVYRALLLRALEGYVSARWALVIQAAVFELVHAYVYGHGSVTGAWFIGGLVLGYAFQRSRSLAVPTLLHAAHNFLLFVLIWRFSTH